MRNSFGVLEFFLFVLLLLLMLFVLIVPPLLTIFALNVLFNMNIPITVETFFAALWINLLLANYPLANSSSNGKS